MASTASVRCADDRYDGSAFPTAELRAIAFDGQPGMQRHLALLLLGARDYQDRIADLAGVVSDAGQPLRLRVIAAEWLGRIATPATVDALRRALTAGEPVVVRSVVHALGWAGGRESLPDLDRLARHGGSPAGPAAAAAALVRFRHGLGGDALPAARLLAPNPKASALVSVRPASKTAIEAAVKDLRASAPGLRLEQDRALAFSCADSKSMVLSVSHPGRGVGRMLERRTLLAVLAEQLAAEDEGWEVGQLVVTEPAGERRARIALVSPRGRLTMDGFADVDGSDRARFVVTTVEASGAVPAIATGSIVGDRMTIERLEVGTERHRPLRPVRLRAGPAGARGAPR